MVVTGSIYLAGEVLSRIDPSRGPLRRPLTGFLSRQDQSVSAGRLPFTGGPTLLCFRPLSMQKTKKSIAKRFKLTATGKLVRRTPGFRHLLATKSTKQKRRASKDKLVAEGHAKPLKRALPFGL